MLKSIVAILLVVGTWLILKLLFYGLDRMDSYEFMSLEDYKKIHRHLNEKAKRVVRIQQLKKEQQKKQQSNSASSPIDSILGDSSNKSIQIDIHISKTKPDKKRIF